jgi:hypothetical protein
MWKNEWNHSDWRQDHDGVFGFRVLSYGVVVSETEKRFDRTMLVELIDGRPV